MTWTKIADDFPEDCADLPDAAFRLHMEGLVYSMRKLTEGRVQKTHLRRFATNVNRDGSVDGLQELLTHSYTDEHGQPQSYWQDAGDHYRICHQMEHQPSKQEVQRRQAQARVNGAKGGRPPKEEPTSVTDQEPTLDPTSEPRSVSEGEKTQIGTQAGNPHRNPTGRDGPGLEQVTASKEEHVDLKTGELRSTPTSSSLGYPFDDPAVEKIHYDVYAEWGQPAAPAWARGKEGLA